MWQVTEARNRFSELITRALTERPQRVRRRGETVVVLSEAEYERLAGKHAKKMSLGEHLLTEPKVKGLVIERDRSSPRQVNLDFADD
jgi:prevent-host-death family protein